MKLNIGPVDRYLRIAVGIGLLAMMLLLEGDARWWGLVGLVPLVTGLVGNCPLYSMLGIDSCPVGRQATGP